MCYTRCWTQTHDPCSKGPGTTRAARARHTHQGTKQLCLCVCSRSRTVCSCWRRQRVGFPGCYSPLVVCCFPPCGVFPPAVCGGCAPLRSFAPARSFAFMGPPGELSGVATPDLGWQQSGRRGRATTARISTSAETPSDTQASQRHGSGTVISTSSAQSGLPTQQAQYDSYNN